jgi:hypothetical protein
VNPHGIPADGLSASTNAPLEPDTPASPEAAAPTRLALLEVVGRDGRVLRSVDVQRWPLTLGRSLAADVVLDDPFVAPLHATLQAGSDGQLMLEVGDTDNGVLSGRQRHARGSRLPVPPAGASWQLGGLGLRLRLPAETLAPEQPLPTATRRPWLAPAATAGVLMLLVAASHWRQLDPGHDANEWLVIVTGLPLALMLWCGLWALGSKLFQHRFEFMAHLRIALPAVLAVEVLDWLLPPLAASLGWPGLWRLTTPLQGLVLLWLLRAHLLRVLPGLSRAVSSFVATAGIAFAVVAVSSAWRNVDRWSRPPYMSTLPLPATQFDEPEPAAVLVDELAPLAAQLAERVAKARAEEPPETDDSPEPPEPSPGKTPGSSVEAAPGASGSAPAGAPTKPTN